MNRRLFPAVCLLASAALAMAACSQSAPVNTAAPQETTAAAPAPPKAVPDPDAEPVSRASPPMLTPVALGTFEPGNPVAQATTGKLTIDDLEMKGENGSLYKTERVAIVRGGDQYSAGQTYGATMQVEASQAIELRRVIEQTPPKQTPANSFCGAQPTGFIALAKISEGSGDVIKLIALQGSDLPAASAQGVGLCASMFYMGKALSEKATS
ncbi:hypothetical protein [Lysobacter enzymogenes]|uniref:Lipoprotein n=1 Tax=Lysobacter enzymogenes TaxID=69 RepID=A0AAU9AMR0_LYSEN|nr:hypothetical protein [Lysobacter enzymogenes]BAV98410.1 conserved hypothetical protein [Lysobacter enzymogenes]